MTKPIYRESAVVLIRLEEGEDDATTTETIARRLEHHARMLRKGVLHHSFFARQDHVAGRTDA